MKRSMIFLLALVFAFVAQAAEPAPLTTVILVRHAEKDLSVKQDDNTPLSTEGASRAQRLRELLVDSGVSVIYTTKTVRTRTTGAPLAEQLKLTMLELETKEAPESVAQKLRAHAGATILVVGHSNTTPALIRALGIPNAPEIADDDFGNVFIVTLGENVAPKMMRLRY